MDWYFDFISPFAYLQWRHLQRERPELSLQPRPVLLAGLLDHWRSVGPAEIPAKRRFTYRFVLWQARRMGVPLRFPPAHPFNPLPGLRLCIAAGCDDRAVSLLFDYIWRDGQAADSVPALASVAHALGIDDPEAALADPTVKRVLIDNGRAAIAAGVFGVPTLVVGGEAFWGLDATAMALDWQAGLDPELARAFEAIETLPTGASRAR